MPLAYVVHKNHEDDMNTLHITPRQIERFCEPQIGRSRYRGLKGTELLVRVTDGFVVTETNDFLTDKQMEIAHNALKSAVDNANGCSDEKRDRQWAITAVQRELEAIGKLHGDNPHRPDSEFWKCLIRIASVLKGSGRDSIPPARVKAAILRESPTSLRTKGNREKDIEYLFGRAMNQANPRYRIK